MLHDAFIYPSPYGGRRSVKETAARDAAVLLFLQKERRPIRSTDVAKYMQDTIGIVKCSLYRLRKEKKIVCFHVIEKQPRGNRTVHTKIAFWRAMEYAAEYVTEFKRAKTQV